MMTMMSRKFTNLLMMTLLMVLSACLPTPKQSECGGSEAYNPTLRRCVPTLGSTAGGLVTITGFFPAVSSYTQSIAGLAVQTHSITVNDPYNSGFQVKWFVRSGSVNTQVASNVLNYNFNPSLLGLGVGTHFVEANVYDTAGNVMLANRAWTVVITNNQIPSFNDTLNSPNNASFTKLTTDTSFNFSATALNPENATGVYIEWSINGVAQVPTTSVSNVLPSTTSTLLFNPNRPVGTYVVQATVRSISTLYDIHAWTVFISTPTLPIINATTSPPTASVVTAIDGISLAANGFTVGGTPASFCLSVNLANGTGSGTYTRFYHNGTPITGNLTFPGNNLDVCLDAAAPAFNIALPVGSTGAVHTIVARAFDVASGYELGNTLTPITWQINVRPKNTAPVISAPSANLTANSCTGVGIPSCPITQDALKTFQINVFDDDYPNYLTTHITNFQVQYYLNGTLLDGSHPLSSSNCNRAFAYNNAADKFNCALVINSYNSSGPVTPPTSYTLTAIVSDNGSPYPPSTAAVSNTLTWTLTPVTEAQTAPVIQAQATLGPITQQSFIALSGAPTTPVAAATEGNTVIFSVNVLDNQRDNYERTIDLCGPTSVPGNCAAPITTISPLAVQTRTTNNAYHRSTFVWTIPQWVVTGAATATKYFRITTRDLPNTVLGITVDTMFSLNVSNFNPVPTISLGSVNPGFGDALTVMAGYPISLKAGPATDLSTSDGNIVKYKWQAKVGVGGNAWYDITENDAILGAGDPYTLVWTPPAHLGIGAGEVVQIRVCIGDDGFGNEVSTCTSDTLNDTASPYTWTNITVRSNVTFAKGQSITDGAPYDQVPIGEVATWTDPSSSADPAGRAVYTAYVSGGGSNITVDKTFYRADGTTAASLAASVVFNAYSTPNGGGVPMGSPIRDLSIVGSPSENSLYISYIAEDALAVPRLRVRRINMRNGGGQGTKANAGFVDGRKFGFLYTSYNLASSQGGITDSVGGPQSNGTSIIQFNAGVAPWAGDITLNGVAIPYATFCGGCTNTTSAATALADYVNNSADLALAGISAVAAANQVTFHGLGHNGVAGDAYDSSQVVTQAGDIQVANGNWHIPFINGSRSMPHTNKISVLYGPIDTYLQVVGAVTSSDLDSTYQSNRIASCVDSSGDLMIAAADYNGDTNLFQVADSAGVYTNAGVGAPVTDIFSGENITKLRMACANGTNSFHYVVAEKTNLELIATRSEQGNITSLFDASNALSGYTTSTADFAVIAGPDNGSAMLAVIVENPALAGDFRPYLLELRSPTPVASSVPYFTCSQTSSLECIPAGAFLGGVDDQIAHTFSGGLALSPLKVSTTIGTIGNTANENVKDVLALAYPQNRGGPDRVVQALMNVERELIQSTSLPTINEHAYVPPFIKP